MAQLINTTINGTLETTGNFSLAGGELSFDGSNLIQSSTIFKETNYHEDPCYFGEGNETYFGQDGNLTFSSGSGSISFLGNIILGTGATAEYIEETNYNSISIGTDAEVYYQGSIAIGARASAGVTQGSYGSMTGVAIGEDARATDGVAIGKNATCKKYGININAGTDGAGYDIAFGVNGATRLYYTGNTTAITSDLRDKTDFLSLDEKALEFINKVPTYTYVNNSRCDYSTDGGLTYNVEEHEKETKKGSRRHVGVKAQEVYELMKNVFGDDNYASIVDNNHYDNPDNPHFDRYFVRYESFIPFLIKSIQEQQKQIEELKTEIEKMKSL